MDDRQLFLLQAELYKEISLFIDCVDDKEERKQRIKEAILYFNKKYGTDTEEVIIALKKMLEEDQNKKLNEVSFEDREPEI